MFEDNDTDVEGEGEAVVDTEGGGYDVPCVLGLEDIIVDVERREGCFSARYPLLIIVLSRLFKLLALCIFLLSVV